MDNIKEVEKKWQKFIPVWGGCPDPSSVTLDMIQNTIGLCNPK
jgi:hypothetical protein